MPIAPVLQTFVNDELARAPVLIERVAAGSLQLLNSGKESVLAAAERGYQAPLLNALATHSAAYRNEFIKALGARVRDALLEQSSESLPGQVVAPSALELMDETRVEIDIEISRAMQLIEATTEWELRELQMFTSTLVGQKHVSAESNPFRPQVYAAALWQAACAVSALQVHRTILLRVSAGVAAGLLKNAWAAACTRLEALGVQPSIYRTVLLPSGSNLRGPATADVGRTGSIGNLLASMPPGPATKASGAKRSATARGSADANTETTEPPDSSQFDQVMTRLDELLRQSPASAGKQELTKLLGLCAQRAELVALATEPQDRQVIELMSHVFDTLLSDPHIPLPFIGTLARLQASALRVALMEPSMFDSTKHATWQLLDRIGEAALVYPQANDPRAQALLAACRALVDTVAQSGKPEAGLYRRAVNQLEGFLADQHRLQLTSAQPAIQSLQLAERRELLEQLLSRRLIDQMANVRTTPIVRRFITSTWARVLAEAMLTHGEQGERTRSYIKLVDELQWSLQLPDHPRSRQRLLTLLPDMLKRLRAGMTSIGLGNAEQQPVLDELMAIHTEALRPGGPVDSTVLSSEQIVQRMRDEVLPASTGNGGFSDSVIDLASMETIPAALIPSDSSLTADDPVDRIAALQPGQRLRLFVQGRWSRVQLLWRSDQGMFFLFAGEAAGTTHSITRRALERLAGRGA